MYFAVAIGGGNKLVGTALIACDWLTILSHLLSITYHAI